MIPFRGITGIKNLHLSKRCNICGKKMLEKLEFNNCCRCYVYTEFQWYYIILKYIRFSIRKYVYGEGLKIVSIPGNYTGNLKSGDSI